MKLNLGCGFNKIEGFLNVDKYKECQPDLVADLEITPWEFGTSEVDTVIFSHSLEHMGRDVDVFFSIIKEVYRVCKSGALVNIHVPHPRHDDFIEDPTHVRIITPELLGLFSKSNCDYWKMVGASNSQLAYYLDVDFEEVQSQLVLEKKYFDLLEAKKISQEDLDVMVKERNNVVKEFFITLEVVKDTY